MKININEKDLYKCALAIEKDAQLQNDMIAWKFTVGDGFDNSDRIRIQSDISKK